jgi:hypothetical protein
MKRTIQFLAPAATRNNQLSFIEPGSPPEHPAVTLDLPAGKRRFTLAFSACENPVCSCRDLNVSLRPSDRPADSVALLFTFDSTGVSIANEPEDGSVAEAFTRRFTDEDWPVLFHVLFKLKADRSEISDASEIDAQFPEEILADPACLLGYKEVFPCSADLEFNLSGVSWTAFERYCTNPDCKCASVLVEFIPKPAAAKAPRHSTQTKDSTMIYFDYRAATQRLEPKGTKGLADPRELVDALQAVCPNWMSRFERRHGVLTQWHRKARESLPVAFDSLAQAPRPRKAGRNEKCPCGSGKKYKHCCGR